MSILEGRRIRARKRIKTASFYDRHGWRQKPWKRYFGFAKIRYKQMYTEVHLFMPAPFQRPKLNLLAVPIDLARKEHKKRNRAKDAEQKKREYISPNLRCFQVIQKKNQDKNRSS